MLLSENFDLHFLETVQQPTSAPVAQRRGQNEGGEKLEATAEDRGE